MGTSRVRFAGGGGFNPPNDFLDPPSLRRFELLGGSILTPVLVLLHVSACGASTLSTVGDPPPMLFSQIGHWARVYCPVIFDYGDMLYGDWTYSSVPAFMEN